MWKGKSGVAFRWQDGTVEIARMFAEDASPVIMADSNPYPVTVNPTQLAFDDPGPIFDSGNTSFNTTQCEKIHINVQDFDGDREAVFFDTLVNLSEFGATAKFYGDQHCWHEISSVTVREGSDGVDVYFLDPGQESGSSGQVYVQASDATGFLGSTNSTLVVAAGAPGALSFPANPAISDWGRTYLGSKVGPGVALPLTVTEDNGVSVVVDIPGSVFTGASAFGYYGGTYPGLGGNCGRIIQANESCTIMLALTPTASGLVTGTFRLKY